MPVQVLATSRGDYSAEAARIGVEFCGDPDDFCEAHPDVVVLATSITSTVHCLTPGMLALLTREGMLNIQQNPVQIHDMRVLVADM